MNASNERAYPRPSAPVHMRLCRQFVTEECDGHDEGNRYER